MIKFNEFWRPLFAVSCLLIMLAVSALSIKTIEPNIVTFKGKLEDDSVEKLISTLDYGSTLRISSSGGQIRAAIKLANHIRRYGIQVEFYDECLSACAEIILPTAPKREVNSHLVIGFHGNPMIYRQLHADFDPRKRVDCFSKYADQSIELLENSNADVTFWRRQYEIIRPKNVVFLEDGSRCGRVFYDLSIEMWFPNSVQLGKFLKDPDFAQTCNDSASCMKRRVLNRNKNKSFMIGDEVFVVK